MPENISKQLKLIVRGISLLLSLALIIWSFYGGNLIGGSPGFGLTQGAILIGGVVLALSSLVNLNWNIGVLAIFLSVGLTLIAAELILRPVLGPRYFGVFQLDKHSLYKLIPSTSREYNRQSVNEQGFVRYKVNSDGFRGEELVKSDDHMRVVVYGDSFVHAEFSVLENTFTEKLEEKLSFQLNHEVEVVNAGVAGYGPDQIARRMDEELGWLDPDMIVVGVFSGNDFGDLLRSKLYKLDKNGNLESNKYLVSKQITRKMVLSRSELLLKKILREVVRNQRLSNNTEATRTQSPKSRVEASLTQNNEEYQRYILEGDNTVRELASDPYNADVSLLPESDSAIYKKRLMDRVLEKIKRISDSQAIPLILMIIPHPMDVLGGSHDSGEVDKDSYPAYDPNALTDALQHIAQKHEIDHVNLFGAIQQRGASKLYFTGGDDHWNDLGQEVAADAVAEFIISLPKKLY